MDWAVGEWIEAVGGRLIAGEADTRIFGVSTDSRTLEPGRLFVALKGPNFDGHDFCGEAVKKGAVAVMASDPAAVASLEPPVAAVLVEDTLTALGQLAGEYRSRFSPIVGALSGSSGKTTTKEMVRAIIEPLGGMVSPGNFNNRIGVPLAIFGLEPAHNLALFELAMNQPGELAALTKIVRPHLVALTNVGTAHSGNFASPDDLRRAKAELIIHSGEDCDVILNADCYGSMWIGEQFCADRKGVTFGIEAPAIIRAEQIAPLDPLGHRFDLVVDDDRIAVAIHTIGRHNIMNALCAASIALVMGAEMEAVRDGLATFRPVPMRSEILEIGRVTVIADYYNANPDSMEAALEALSEFAGNRRKVVLFADMLELGDDAEMAHRQVGQAAADHGVDLFATTGELAQWASWEAGRMMIRAGHFDTKEEAVDALVEELGRGDVLLVKGSRLMGLEDVIERLKERL